MKESYYIDESSWGDGRLTLKDVIDRIIIEASDEDSFIRNAERGHLILLCKKALRDIGYITNYSAKGVKFSVPMSLSMPVEEDFADLIRVSVVEDCKLYRIKEYVGTDTAIKSYLQSCKGDLVFDKDGQIYDYDSWLKCREPKEDVGCDSQKCCVEVTDKYKDSTVQVVDDTYVFSYDLEDKEVLVEYMSNGLVNELDECEIKLKLIYEEAIIYYVYWKYLERRVNTQNKSVNFKQMYDLEMHKIRRNHSFANLSDKRITELIGKYR